jgi:multimeric flavodoxin WrbA
MKIVLINGTDLPGTTYRYAHQLALLLGGELTEFFLPKDFHENCFGCTACLYKSETLCPHYSKLAPITKAIDEADVLIFASPTYVYHVTGAMKSLLDHYAYRFMLHRPVPSDFHKIGVAISTCAGGGAKETCQDIIDSFYHWGIAKTYALPFVVRSSHYDQIPAALQKKAMRKIGRTAKQILRHPHPKPGMKTKSFFFLAKKIHASTPTWAEADLDYWAKQGWDRSSHPW